MKVSFDGTDDREVGVFIDFHEFRKLYLGSILDRPRKLLSSQELRKRYPQVIAKNPENYSHRFFITHRWETQNHPDLSGWQKDAILQLGAEYESDITQACFWYDYCSLPQKPRSPTEDKAFQLALHNIGYLCRNCSSVPLISGNDKNLEINISNLLKRGWILFELFVSCESQNIKYPIFESSPTIDRITYSKVNYTKWDDLIPKFASTLPFYNKEFIRQWFDLNDIVCTNESDLDHLADMLAHHVHDYVASEFGNTNPSKLIFNTTVEMDASHVSAYYINRYGFSSLFPDTHFHVEYKAKKKIYFVTPYFRPNISKLNTEITISQSVLEALRIDEQSGTSNMYPGLIFKLSKKNGLAKYIAEINTDNKGN